ncbi:MAG TPA: MlaD family protein [Chryseosolibacter sp.]
MRIQFDSAEKVRAGDIVILQDVKIGAVKSVRIRTGGPAVVVIVLDKPADFPQGTGFILSYDIFGTPFISIEPGNGRLPIDPGKVQKGTVKDSQIQKK